MSYRVAIVVHRYAPFPGGSEYYCQDIAEEFLKRGHDVTVLAHEHKGNLNGVRVTSNYQILVDERFDLIIVHGGDCITQNIIHSNALMINSPVLYMLIKPSDSAICQYGMGCHKYLGYSTSMDMDHIIKYHHMDKARRVRHGINLTNTVHESYASETTIYTSAGGFWPHKGMVELANAWNASDLDAELHLFGYGPGEVPPTTDRVKTFQGLAKEDVHINIASSDGYIMNSFEEGFGLVLLEAMANYIPWYSRKTAGALDMAEYGTLYNDEGELMNILKNIPKNDVVYKDWNDMIAHEDSRGRSLRDAFDYVATNHTITQTVNDIEDIIDAEQV